jgi:hypothetical protein
MNDDRDARSYIEAAKQAADAGDYATTERHLREAVRRQEAELGPIHPDVANTLNNLGVACEFNGNLDEAEVAFRRAYAIASSVLLANHPFVTTSAENLRNFCEARGRPFERTTEPVLVPEPRMVAAEPAAMVVPNSRSRWIRRAAMMVVAVGLAAAWWFAGGARVPEAPADVQTDKDATANPPAPEEPTVTEPSDSPVDSAADSPQSGRAEGGSTPVPERTAPPVTAPSFISVVAARLCSNFSTTELQDGEWRCDTSGEVVPPGALVFYTRLKSAGPTTVEHRWYRNGALHHRVALRVAANQGPGYRTYSRTTITPAEAGEWRVELRGPGGALLHGERFLVR